MPMSILTWVPGMRGALGAVIAGGVLMALSLGAQPVYAQSVEGAWSGSGTIIYASGERERARCRASFRPMGGGGLSMRAVCATASARVVQNAALSRLTRSTYSGEFYNTEYGVQGSIRLRVQGNKISASLKGGGGSAQFTLSR